MGAHSCELYCNMGICCLYGGHLDLILPCFQRAIFLALEPNQKSSVWYNLSFVALVRISPLFEKKIENLFILY